MKPKVGQQHIERIYVKVTKHSGVIIFKKVKLRDDVTKSTFLILFYCIKVMQRSCTYFFCTIFREYNSTSQKIAFVKYTSLERMM